MKADVKLYYEGKISAGWKNRLGGESIGRIPAGIARHPREARELVQFLEELSDFDWVIIHHHVEPFLALYLSKLLGPKTVWYSGSVFELAWERFITGIDYRSISPTVRRTAAEFYGDRLSNILLSNALYGFASRTARMLDTQTVRGYGKIIANSFFLSRSLSRLYGLRQLPAVVYPGPDPLLEQLASENHAEERDYMLAVGSLIPLKNVESMVRAAANVKTPKIVLVGDGQEKSRLKDLAFRLEVPIEFWGTYDGEEELARAYAQSKFLVHLSLYEPFGLTPVEAGLFSKPSIVTRQGGPPEVVVDGVTGFVVDPKDYESIASRMNSLLWDESLRREMGRCARENVTRKFTLENSTRRLLEELEY